MRSSKAIGIVKRSLWIMFPFFVIFVVWQTVAWLDIFPEYLFPSPVSVLEDFIAKAVGTRILFLHIKESLIRLALGYAAGIMGGVLFGVAMGMNKFIARFFEPPISFLQAIPVLAWTPLVILWFGIGYKAVTIIIFLAVFFPVLFNTLTGVRTLSSKFINVASMTGAKKWQIIAYVLLPGALPSIITGIRVGAAYGWRALVAAEMIASTSGLGFMILDAREWLMSQTIILGAITIGIIWIAMDRLFLKTLETKTIERWGMVSTR